MQAVQKQGDNISVSPPTENKNKAIYYLPTEPIFFILSAVLPIWKFPQGGGKLSQRPFRQNTSLRLHFIKKDYCSNDNSLHTKSRDAYTALWKK